MNSLELTEDAVQLMIRQIEQDMTVQTINLKKVKTTNRIMCELSDGISKIRGYITEPKVTEADNNAIILIKSFGLLTQKEKPVGVVVHICEILDHYIEEIGKPIDVLRLQPGEQHNKENQKPVIVPQKLKSYIDKNKPENGNHEIAATQQPNNNRSRPIERMSQKNAVSIEQASNGKVNDSEKIAELYPDLQNWEIIARLIKKNYRQFVSKSGKGKLTKVLNLQFMDISGMKITGAMFGDSAVEFYQALEEDSIYRVSKGQIRQDQYNQNKGRNYSRHTIMFTRNSLFVKISNTQLLPHYEAKLTDLGTISQHRNIGEEYDAVAIILSILDQVQIPKQTRTLYKQVFQICDPVNEFVMEAIIWNRNIPIDDTYLGRTVAMCGFRLNSFNDRLSLNSSYQSQIKILDKHPYRSYEGKVERERLQMLSEKKQKNVEIEEPCKNLKQLENQLVYLEHGKEIKSTMTLMLTLISYKKWSYESCPHCRKSAEANQKCNHCQKYIEQTIPRYKLNVELSDCCGSVWATGFEELGARLFYDFTEGIKGIKELDEAQRHRLFEKKQFQQFTFKLTSKFDRDGNVKHTVNRIYDFNLMGKVQENIKRIKDHLE